MNISCRRLLIHIHKHIASPARLTYFPVEKTEIRLRSTSLKLHTSEFLHLPSYQHQIVCHLKTITAVSKNRMVEESKSSGKRKLVTDDDSSPEKKQKTTDDTNHTDVKLDFLNKVNNSRKNVCKSVSEFKFNKKRVRILSKAKDFSEDCQGVVYWMSRDQRVQGTKKLNKLKCIYSVVYKC